MAHLLTVPNILTGLRLASLPVVILLFRAGENLWAAAVFAAAMLTDCVDGWLAKRLKLETPLGLYLDPVTDKIVILAMFYELAYAGLLSWVIPHAFLARELLQNAVRSVAARKGRVVGANKLGKTKALLQTLVILWGLILPARPASGETSELAAAFFHAAAWFLLALSFVFFAIFIRRNSQLLFGSEKR